MKKIAEKLICEKQLNSEELIALIANKDSETDEFLFKNARRIAAENYGKKVFLRGLIEISNYCRNNCYYCGIRAGNKCAERYRLEKKDILDACALGNSIGLKTFVLQGGEDAAFSDEVLADIISDIKNKYPEAAVTLSLGERSYDSYKILKEAGADRYLLRHESADKALYNSLHPGKMSFENRMRCLKDLKSLGFQTGCGFMVGAPGQTKEHLLKDIEFIKNFRPEMVGIGPFIPHKDTPYKDFEKGDVLLTLRLLAIVRIMLPDVLLPATTALSTVDENGHIRGVLAGANVVMPNLTPMMHRNKYMLYDNKAATGVQAAEGIEKLKQSLNDIGYDISYGRGDNIKFKCN